MPTFSRLKSMAKTKVFAERRKQDEREKASDAKYVADANKKKENAENDQIPPLINADNAENTENAY